MVFIRCFLVDKVALLTCIGIVWVDEDVCILKILTTSSCHGEDLVNMSI